MKKSLIAMAALAVAGVASAQSSVTLFGVVDAQIQSIRGDGNGRINQLANSGYNSSRLGFRGTEDLGGGMSASFWLEAGLGNDSGVGAASNTNNTASGGNPTLGGFPSGGATAVRPAGTQGLTFNRRSTVSLAGGWGELRLGRDYVPAFWNLTLFDPFGTNGVGSSTNLTIGAGGGTTGSAGLVTSVRASNSVGYFLPSTLGGFYGQAMYAFSEIPSTCAAPAPAATAAALPAAATTCPGADGDGRHVGGRLGYAAGPLNIAVAFGNTDYASGDYKQTNIGGQWDFGVAKLLGQWARDEVKSVANPRQTSWLIGTLVPMGAGEIRASYVRTNVANSTADGSQLALGYVHNLSKRTAVYTTWSRVDNRGAGVLFHNGRAATTAGGNATGFDLGVRHSF